MRSRQAFTRYAWAFLAFNVLVIVWGALVRATGSGAGCGAHWPLCNGEWIPVHPQFHTIIELTHRVMSGLALAGVIVLWLWSLRSYPKGSWVRKAAAASLVLTLSEALIGAGLVLLRLVAQNASSWRAAYLSVHLTNTFLLLASLSATAAWSQAAPAQWIQSSKTRVAYALGLAGFLVVGVSGGIAALGDTLFPSTSLRGGIARDFSSSSHFLIRLRVIHPLLAAGIGLYLGALAIHGLSARRPVVRGLASALAAIIVCQWGIGLWNLTWLAPIPLQLVHLAAADALWIILVLYSLTVLTTETSPARGPSPSS